MFAFKIGVLLCLCHFSLQKSTPEDDSYIAAVVEMNPKDDTMENLAQCINIIKEAAKKNVDVIVFPEKAITIYDTVEVPIYGRLKEFPVPADNEDLYDKILVDLSAAAKKYEMYVVVNLRERVNCTTPNNFEKCPGTQVFLYNTNVVFDRQGAVIERASKYHLFFEPEFSEEFYSNVSQFTTDFGVTFGTVISFDLLFTIPTAELVTQMQLKNIIMTSNWCPEPPFLGSIQTQNAFQYGYNVNFLVAGRNDWKNGYSGSGIYSGKAGALVSIIKNITNYRLLVAEVPKTPGKITKKYPGPTKVDPAELDGTSTCIDSSLDKFILEPLKDGYQELTYMYQDITCNFKVNITLGKGEQSYVYRTAVFSGVRRFGFNETGGARACAIIACSGEDINSCGKRLPNYNEDAVATFSQLTIMSKAPKRILIKKKIYDSTYFQTSLTTSLSSVQPKDIELKKKTVGNFITYTLSLKKFDEEILSFGFWGRKFTDDGKKETTPRIENTGNNVLKRICTENCDNSTSTEETPQKNFSILGAIFALLKTLTEVISRILREIRARNIHL